MTKQLDTVLDWLETQKLADKMNLTVDVEHDQITVTGEGLSTNSAILPDLEELNAYLIGYSHGFKAAGGTTNGNT